MDTPILDKEKQQAVIDDLVNFVHRVSNAEEKRWLQEIAILPAISELLLGINARRTDNYSSPAKTCRYMSR